MVAHEPRFFWVPSTRVSLGNVLKELSNSPGNTEGPRTTQTKGNPGTAGNSQTDRNSRYYLSYRTDLCLVRMMEEIQKKINKKQIIIQ